MRQGFLRLCVAALALWIVSIAGAGRAAPPVIDGVSVTPDPSGAAPLTAVIRFQTDSPSRAWLELSDGENNWSSPPETEPTREHELMALGLRPAKEHNVTIVARNAQGEEVRSELPAIQAPPLPELFPPLDVRISKPDKMEPGVTLFDPMHWPAAGPDGDLGLLIIVDARGEVLWYYQADHGIGDARRLRNGNFGYHHDRGGGYIEIDMLGHIVRRWYPTALDRPVPEGSIEVDTQSFHHEVFERASGNFVTLSTEIRAYDDYPSSESDPDRPRKRRNVIGDIAIEFTPEGEIVREHKLLDILDPYRIGYGSLGGGYWGQIFKDVAEGPAGDWAHTNAIVYDPADGTALMSMYNQDMVFKIDWETGELRWILGTHDGWGERWLPYLLEPVGDVIWPFHTHGVKVTPHGTILMFDNGTYRVRPFEERPAAKDSYSRVVEFAVDEEKMEVSEVWAWGGPEGERFFSRFISDADWLPSTGNVLVADGGRVRNAAGEPAASFFGHHWARIIEVTHEQPAEKVFEIVIDAPEPEGWAVYRAAHLSSLYP